MANYAHNVVRVTLSGTMFGGAEVWSTGFFLGEEGSDAPDPTDVTPVDILAAWRTYFENASSHVSSLYLTTQCKVAKLDDNGQTIPGTVFYAYPATELNGAISAGYTLPPQCSLVVTLLSDRPRGKASKGRMYLPGIAATISSNGKLLSGTVGTIADNLKTFFDSLANDADIPGELILAAKSSGVMNVNPAQNDYVETIKVGDVIDTQRRRRNGLTETYVSRVLA
jgi:hypothetical protein